MAARAFISCGQREGEHVVALAIADALSNLVGLQPYVALDAQSIQDVNSGILGELRRSDYYVFVDFRREPLSGSDEGLFRGSLFSHQELAIAYALGFEHAIFFRERNVKLEGVCAYIASNATVFEDRSTLPALVTAAAKERGWNPGYSRNLVLGPIRLSDELIQYRDLQGRFLYADVQNRRPDVGATGVVARLAALHVYGGTREVSPNRSHLKVTGQQSAFQQTIWPNSHGAFDLLCIDAYCGSRVYLNNALDVLPTPVLFDRVGEHLLEYEVYANGFERLSFTVRLRTSAACADAAVAIVGNDDKAV